MLKRPAGLLALLALSVVASASAQNAPGPITVFTARKIITMDPSRPAATAVAVRDGRILGVGSLRDLQPWLKNNKYTVDERMLPMRSSRCRMLAASMVIAFVVALVHEDEAVPLSHRLHEGGGLVSR